MTNWVKLTPEEKQHLADMGVKEGEDLELLFKAQDEVRTIYHMEPCWECKTIARRLGYEPVNHNA